MAQIGIQSEAFLQLYEKLRPQLQTLAIQGNGFQRAVLYEMPIHLPGPVLNALDEIQRTAIRAETILGAGKSTVVVDGNDLSAIEWAQKQVGRVG